MNKMLPRWEFEGDAYITHDHKYLAANMSTNINILNTGIHAGDNQI